MDTDALVEKRFEDGQRLIDQLLVEGFEVTAAFWLKASWNEKWYFYIVSPLVDKVGIAKAYGRLRPIRQRMPEPFHIRPLGITLIGPSEPIARDALAAYQRLPRPVTTPIHWPGRHLGNEIIEDAYFYPLPAGAATA
jgi:hypothetical protein